LWSTWAGLVGTPSQGLSTGGEESSIKNQIEELNTNKIVKNPKIQRFSLNFIIFSPTTNGNVLT